jgi:hypothetical protein
MPKDPFADQETIEQSVTITREFAERLADEYSGALNLSEALRNAAKDAVATRENNIVPEDITESVRKAVEQTGAIAVESSAGEQTDG